MTRQNRIRIISGSLMTLASVLSVQSTWAYTQSYVTFWETTPVTSTTNQYSYWIFNTGTADSTWETTVTNPNPLTIETHVHSETPLIMNYEIPILSEAALNSIDQTSIYQPEGWTYEFIDPTGVWTNTTGDPLFDNPYRILHWYTNDMARGIYPVGGDITGAEISGGCLWGGEGGCGEEFGLTSVFSPILGPDQTSWGLEIIDFTYTTVVQPLPPIVGDPDLQYGSNGFAGGGVAVIAAVGPNSTPNQVPEPGPLGLLALGVGMLAIRARNKNANRV